MATSESDLIETVLRENEAFRKAKEGHAEYAKYLEDLEKKPYLTPQDEVDIKIFKKKKLVYKDEMEKILAKMGK